MGSGVFLVADSGGFALEVAEVEEASATDDATGDDLEFFDAGRMHQKDALDTYVEADLAHGERASCAGAVSFDDDPLENLNALLVAFDDFVVDADCVADPEDGLAGAELRRFELGEFGRGNH